MLLVNCECGSGTLVIEIGLLISCEIKEENRGTKLGDKFIEVGKFEPHN